MNALPNCPKCHAEYVYEDGTMLVCPSCGHEWPKDQAVDEEAGAVVHDDRGLAHG